MSLFLSCDCVCAGEQANAHSLSLSLHTEQTQTSTSAQEAKLAHAQTRAQIDNLECIDGAAALQRLLKPLPELVRIHRVCECVRVRPLNQIY